MTHRRTWIDLHDLPLALEIGVYGHERGHLTRLRLDLSLCYDAVNAGGSDALEHALDYDAVLAELYAAVDGYAPALLESLLEHLQARLYARFDQLQALRICVHKPLPGSVPPLVVRLRQRSRRPQG